MRCHEVNPGLPPRFGQKGHIPVGEPEFFVGIQAPSIWMAVQLCCYCPWTATLFELLLYRHPCLVFSMYPHVSTCIHLYPPVSTCIHMYPHASTCIYMYPHVSTSPLCPALLWPAQVYRQSFWLGLLGGSSPKRLILWSNSSMVGALNLGKTIRSHPAWNNENKTTCPLVYELFGFKQRMVTTSIFKGSPHNDRTQY